MTIFSKSVASVIGNFIEVPKQAHSISFLLKSAFTTPKVVIVKTQNVMKETILIFQLNKKQIPKINSKKGYNLAYKNIFFASGSYLEKLKGKVE